MNIKLYTCQIILGSFQFYLLYLQIFYLKKYRFIKKSVHLIIIILGGAQGLAPLVPLVSRPWMIYQLRRTKREEAITMTKPT